MGRSRQTREIFGNASGHGLSSPHVMARGKAALRGASTCLLMRVVAFIAMVLALAGGSITEASAQAISFQVARPYVVGNFPDAIAIGDFNGDGIADLAVSNAFSANVTIFLGKADGTFTAAANVASGGVPGAIAVGDFNGDGKLDLAICDANGSNVIVFAGNGNGTFTRVGAYFSGLYPTSIATADLNHDGKLDLVIANGTSGTTTGKTVTLLLGSGDGTFRSNIAYSVGTSPTAVVIADFNGDGNPDIAVANGGSNTISLLLGKGDGSISSIASYAVGSYPDALAVADFNHDGHPDLAVGNDYGNNVSILLGRSDGTFAPATNFVTGSGPASIAVADFDGDGRVDLAVVNRFSNTLSVLLGNGNGTFQTAQNYPIAAQASGVVAADLNGDGRIDIVVSTAGANSIAVMLQAPAIPASISVSAGSPQTAIVGAPFGTALAALVLDAASHPLPGVSVTFAAPAAGPAASFPGALSTVVVITNGAGVATAPTLSANGVVGTFNVTAGVGPLNATFVLTNATLGHAPVFTSAPLPGSVINNPYSFTVTATGTPAPTFSVTPYALPLGLTLNGANGVIAGTPVAAGTFAGVLTASNGTPPDATQGFAVTIAGSPQSIAFGALADKPLGAAPFTITATSSASLSVAFTSQTTAVCTVAGSTVTLLAAGSCTIVASQPGNAYVAAAPSVTRTFSVTVATGDTVWVDDALPLGAVPASDGGDLWTWISAAPSPFSGTLAHQSSNASGEHQHYFFSATATLSVGPGDRLFAYVYLDPANPPTEIMLQWNDGSWEHRAYWGSNAIAWGADGTAARHAMGASPAPGQWTRLEVPAAALGLEGRVLNGMAFTINGGRATWDRAGKASVTTQQAQSISFAPLPDREVGSAPFALSATASSGLAVTFESRSLPVCMVSASTVTLIAHGVCTVRASQPGDASHASAPYVERTFTVTSASQTIAFNTLVSPPMVGLSVWRQQQLFATATSGMPVSFSSQTPTVCIVNADILSLVSVGTCIIRASQSGDADHDSAPSVDQSFQVVAAYQGLLFVQPGQQYLLFPKLQPHATASSGLPVTFSSLTPDACKVEADATTVTLTSVGTCTLRATQAGSANFQSVWVDRSFQISSNQYTIPVLGVPGPIIEYATRIGGSRLSTQGADHAFDIAVAPDGSAYVGGSVASTDFPGLSSSTLTNGGLDLMYVAKLSAQHGHVDMATIVGARTTAVTNSGGYAYAGADQVEAMAMGPNGSVYAAAYASSTTYPSAGGTLTRAGIKTVYRVGADGTVQPIAASMDNAVKTVRALAIDAAGAIYITGVASPGLATTPGAAISAATAGGPYLIKFAPGGTNVSYATYLSVAGSRSSIAPDPNRSRVDNVTTGYALAVDAIGNVYVAGQATADDFPVAFGFPDSFDHQNRDAFVAKINPGGSAIVWVARLGGADAERATSIALAPDGGVIIGGKTATLAGQFSAGGGGFQGWFDYNMLLVDRESGFLAKLTPDGTRWSFVAAIGSQGGNLVYGALSSDPSPIKVAVDAYGSIYVTGHTYSDRVLPVAATDLNSPYYYALGSFGPIQSPGHYDDGSVIVQRGVDGVYSGEGAFLMKVRPEGSLLDYSVILSSGVTPTGLAVDAFGSAYVVGYGGSQLNVDAAQASSGEVFVAKVNSQTSPVLITLDPSASVAGQPVAVTAFVSDARYSGSIQFRDGDQLLGTVPIAANSASLQVPLSLGVHRINATFVGTGPFNGARSTDVIQIVNQSTGAH